MPRKVFRRVKSGLVVGFILCLAGLLLLVLVLLKVWPALPSSQPDLSQFWSNLWTLQLVLPFSVSLKLGYVGFSGVALFFGGVLVLALSEQGLFLSGAPVWMTCPFCHNHWKTSGAKGWAECPHCRQFVQPRVKKPN